MASIQDQITAAALANGVDPSLALAVAQTESGFNQDARGAAGEVGVFQLMPTTAAGLKVNPYDITQNINGGVGLLGSLLKKYGGDPSLALAAYNAGEGVVNSGNIPNSTYNYVDTILGAVAGSPTPAALAIPGTGNNILLSSDDGGEGILLMVAVAIGVLVLAS